MVNLSKSIQLYVASYLLGETRGIDDIRWARKNDLLNVRANSTVLCRNMWSKQFRDCFDGEGNRIRIEEAIKLGLVTENNLKNWGLERNEERDLFDRYKPPHSNTRPAFKKGKKYGKFKGLIGKQESINRDKQQKRNVE